MIRRLVTFDRGLREEDRSLLADEDSLIALTPPVVSALTVDDVDQIRKARAVTLLHAEGALGSAPAAAVFHADLFVAGSDARVALGESITEAVVEGMLRRIGRRAVPLMIGKDYLSAEDLVNAGLADVVVDQSRDTMAWLDSWIGPRSLSAVAMTARLLNGMGGDRAERASFSQLFTEDEVREGLSAFLEKRRAEYDSELIRERR